MDIFSFEHDTDDDTVGAADRVRVACAARTHTNNADGAAVEADGYGQAAENDGDRAQRGYALSRVRLDKIVQRIIKFRWINGAYRDSARAACRGGVGRCSVASDGCWCGDRKKGGGKSDECGELGEHCRVSESA